MANIYSYGGKVPPPYLYIEKIKYSVLPQTTIKDLKIPSKVGRFFLGKETDTRTFDVNFAIKAPNSESLMEYADRLGEWLSYDEPQPLVFEDKPNISYYAIVNNDIDLDTFGNIAKGTINFICLDPYGYGDEKVYSFNPTSTEPIEIYNNGSEVTSPVIEMEFVEDATDFAIVTNYEHLYFGTPVDVIEDEPVDLNPVILNDALATTNGWTKGVTSASWKVEGELYSNGYGFSQLNQDYGTGDKWHGGALVKSLGKEIQDFTVDAMVQMKGNDPKQMGRLEVHLMDINGNQIGKMALADVSNNGIYPKFEARAGSNLVGQDSYMFQNSWGDRPTSFANFDGLIRIGRKGTIWFCYIAWVDKQDKHHFNRMYKEHNQHSMRYGQKLAQIQLVIGQGGTQPVVPIMNFGHITVTEHLQKQKETEVDYVFKRGDKLYIDNSTGEILKNGEPYYSSLYPSSKFIKFEQGMNGVSVSSPIITNGNIKFKERWL